MLRSSPSRSFSLARYKELIQAKFPLKIGNTRTFPSEYYFWRRRKLERKLNQATLMPLDNDKVSPFVIYYADLISACASQDFPHLRQICEPSLYKKLRAGLRTLIDDIGAEIFLADQQKATSFKLLKMNIIRGVQIPRERNLGPQFSKLEKDEIISYFHPEDKDGPLPEAPEITQVVLQFTSKLRLWVVKREGEQAQWDLSDERLQVELEPVFSIGDPVQFSWMKETHVLVFEKYTKAPEGELGSGTRRPWVITDIDFFLEGSPHVPRDLIV